MSRANSRTTSQDCGNIVQWEHININVSDSDLTFYFYFQALGFTLDPYLPSPFYNRVYWANVGQQQFHLVRWNQPQVIPGGTIVVQVPSLEQLESRLVSVSKSLKGTSFKWNKQHGQNEDEIAIHVTCPWGNAFMMVEKNRIPTSLRDTLELPSVGYPWELGICSLLLRCAKDSAKGIAEFFRRVLFARVEEKKIHDKTAAVVFLGPRQTVVFEQDESMPLPKQEENGQQPQGAAADDDAMYPDYHLCIYIAEFQKAYERVEALGLLYNDHIFSDKVYSYQDALVHNQFRLRDILDLEAHARGQRRVLYRLQLETRSLYHPFFMRPLVNRMGQVGIYCFQ
ncbi:hypothetical protein GAYE_SCF00G1703 [Galdieria yellowstonensis]|uniref:VOC domain-containing protein n=1 Tax=Galdieria yellowstonensis TaxID=3028027 RepID=A0AAV9I8W1_9RHOD|nr:hypothetical protein GAYE_SCF00G1703 [Galdieria yellowstonensis]